MPFTRYTNASLDAVPLTAKLGQVWFQTGPHTQKTDTEKKEDAGHSRLGDGGFNKWEYLPTRLVLLPARRMSTAPHPPARTFKVYREALRQLCHVTTQMVSITHCSQGCILEMAPAMKTVGGTYIPSTVEQARNLRLPRSRSRVNQWARFSGWPPTLHLSWPTFPILLALLICIVPWAVSKGLQQLEVACLADTWLCWSRIPSSQLEAHTKEKTNQDNDPECNLFLFHQELHDLNYWFIKSPILDLGSDLSGCSLVSTCDLIKMIP